MRYDCNIVVIDGSRLSNQVGNTKDPVGEATSTFQPSVRITGHAPNSEFLPA